jgi:nucleoside-diphosphate-sugar epimerase
VEEALLTGPLEPTNQWYDVVPALITKIHRAKIDEGREVEIWGTGAPRREFLHVADCADALVFLMERYSGETRINIGWGEDVSIRGDHRDGGGIPGRVPLR